MDAKFKMIMFNSLKFIDTIIHKKHINFGLGRFWSGIYLGLKDKNQTEEVKKKTLSRLDIKCTRKCKLK